jgi:asparagine synthase (glutamine-hydrolysing)
MLDSAVVDFSLRLPPSMKVRGQTLRPFFKAASRGFLPDQVIDKEKHGFGLPFGLWLKSSAPLAALVKDTLRELQKRGLFRPEFLDLVQDQHRTGHASYFGYVIWDLVMLEQWLQAHQIRA